MFDIVAGYKLVGSHSGVKMCRWTKVIFDALTMLSCIIYYVYPFTFFIPIKIRLLAVE
jgi:hypothetical protein